MWKNREFKEKDEVIHIEYGKGVVISADDIYGCPIDVRFKHEEVSFYLDGKEFNNSHLPSIFHTDNNPFELAGKYLEMQQAGKQHPTETPIEELGKNDSVFCIANGDCVTEGRTYFVTRNYGDGIAIIDDEKDEHDYDWSEAKQLFRTSPPQTETPIPKITNYEKPTSYSGSASGINRAELLEVASRAMEAMVSHGVTIDIDKDYPFQTRANTCVCIAKALINEVDKEVENGK